MQCPWDPLWRFFAPPVALLRDNIVRRLENMAKVKQNVREMTTSMDVLNAKRASVMTAIEDGTRRQMKSTPEADRWLKEVERVITEVGKVKDRFENRGCFLLQDCSMNCCLSLRIGEEAVDLQKRADSLKMEVDSLPLVRPSPPESIEEKHFSFKVVESATMKSHIHKVRGYLTDDNVGMVGIWGMGGVGKTTLLKKINNSFLEVESLGFHYVIYVAAKRNDTVKNLQSDLATRLGLELPSSNDEQSASADCISKFLNQKNFLLLVDDLWEEVDLMNVGIPVFGSNQHKHKVVITTRFEDVCAKMSIRTRIRVQCLEKDEAMDLLKETVGEIMHEHPELRKLAKDVVEICSQLPLALVLIGQALSTKETPQEWEDMVKTMTKPQSTRFRDLEEKILPTLELTYNSLQTDRVRECFLCCSFWPDEYININDLIECWIGLGLIHDFTDIHDAYNQGHTIIGELKKACLLEHDDVDRDKYVKMHNLVRELALWIVSNHEQYKKRWYVKTNLGLKSVAESVESWNLAKLVSLMNNEIEEVPNFKDISKENSYSLKLSTLILRQNPLLKRILYGFFPYVAQLSFLDLSYSDISWLPADIKYLRRLQHLDLSQTRISLLPIELGNLKELKYLLLRYTRRLRTIPIELISRLSSLQVLDVFPYLDIDCEVLRRLSDLKAISLGIRSSHTLQELYDLPMRHLGLYFMEELSSLSIRLSHFKQSYLEKLVIESCHSLAKLKIEPGDERRSRLVKLYLWDLWNLQEISLVHAVPSRCLPHLRAIVIENCVCLRNISWIKLLPCLMKLWLKNCSMMEIITEIEVGEMDLAFPSLVDLRLEGLPTLHSICNGTLLFSFLESVLVLNCPRLKKLPFKSQTADNKKLRKIAGSREWLEALHWEDESTKGSFLPYFRQL